MTRTDHRVTGDAYTSLLDMDGSATAQELRDRCKKALDGYGVGEDFSSFFADVLHCEYEINRTLHRVHQNQSPDRDDGPGQDPEKLFRTIQELLRNFNRWRNDIDALQDRGKNVPPLKLDDDMLNSAKGLTALCSIETKEVNVKAGDELFITDTSRPNRLKVRNSKGEEGYVPALCCILPTPDKNALTATERLRIQLLAAWVESMKKLKTLLMECLLTSAKKLSADWRVQISGVGIPKERIARRLRRLTDTVTKTAPNWDLTKLHNALFSLEKEMISWNINGGADTVNLIDTIANLDKSVLCYQMYSKQLYLYRRTLEKQQRPIRLFEHWNSLQPIKKGKRFKYFELKMTYEETETMEEVTEVCVDQSTAGYGRDEQVEANQITSATQEERVRFVIRGVVHPLTGVEISIQDAVQFGIVDQTTGMYRNPKTGEGMSIPEAMSNGYIKVEQEVCTRSKEETKAIGLITIKTKIDNRQFVITGVVNAVSGRQMALEEAKRLGIIDEDGSQYLDTTTGEKMPLDTAIQGGWVMVEYEPEPEEPVFESKTFAVNAVVDQQDKKKVPFYEAVKRGLIDRDTGCYINNVTGEKIYVAEAIRRGFLKAKEVEDSSGLDIDAENKVVIERMDKIRKNVLKSMGVIKAFKAKAATND